jgi:hypothetical protein
MGTGCPKTVSVGRGVNTGVGVVVSNEDIGTGVTLVNSG